MNKRVVLLIELLEGERIPQQWLVIDGLRMICQTVHFTFLLQIYFLKESEFAQLCMFAKNASKNEADFYFKL